MECFLEMQPPEIIGLILENTPQGDVLNLLVASRRCNAVFEESREWFILEFLKTSVPKELWTEFCAAQFSSKFERVIHRDNNAEERADVTSFLDRYFSRKPEFDIVASSKEDLITAHSLNRTIWYFIHDLTKSASSAAQRLSREQQRDNTVQPSNVGQGQYEDSKDNNNGFYVSDLSASERCRLYRAFLRLEIHARTFRPVQIYQRNVARWHASLQFDLFLKRFKPWEVEEITCVHQHLSDVIIRTLDELSRAFEDEVLCLAARAACDPKRWISSNTGSYYPLTIGFGHPFSRLMLDFSDSMRRRDAPRASAIVGSGLGYLAKFSRMDLHARFETLRKNQKISSGFLREALLFAPKEKVPASSSDYSDPMQPSAGYEHYTVPPGPGVTDIGETTDNILYRSLGLVFWDGKRIESGLVEEALSRILAAQAGDRIWDLLPVRAYSVEKSLRDVRLPYEDMYHVYAKFSMQRERVALELQGDWH